MSGPQVLQGLSGQALAQNIPEKWDPNWFRSFCINYLQWGDVRNAEAGTGIQVVSRGGVGSRATIQVSTSVQALYNEPYALAVAPSDAFLTEYRVLEPQNGVLTLTDGGATSNLTIGVATNGIGDAQFRQSAPNTVVGNPTGSTANVTDLTQAQLTALINDFTSSFSGAVPASGGGTVNFLRADGTFDEPAYPVSANPSASVGLSAVDGTATTFMTSDSAPALSQAISPTWSGNHKFSNPIGVNGNSGPAQSTGWGTPTGGSVSNNFAGASATLAQTSAAVAELIAVLKAIGFLGT